VTAALPARSRLSIGEVLGELRADFPDVTISKIRFLEAEGLVEPERTTSGYRKFSRDDMRRLRYILTAQREHYLPLKVIKEHLEAMDRGLEPPAVPGGGPPRVPMMVLSTAGYPTAEAFKVAGTELRLSRTELIDAAGIDDTLLSAIEGYGLVRTRTGSEHYDGDALLVAKTVAELAAFGLEPRHLRAFKTAADRQVGLFEQVVTPLLRQRDPAAKARAADVLTELAAASVRLHATLVKIGLRSSR
jgi:DNA-binding transcriptional MerR regulator